jgi:hypothetical protein
MAHFPEEQKNLLLNVLSSSETHPPFYTYFIVTGVYCSVLIPNAMAEYSLILASN